MKRIVGDIQLGRFVKEWMLENKVNQTSFKAMHVKLGEHPGRGSRQKVDEGPGICRRL
jgi:ketol-acid reductoisomerase